MKNFALAGIHVACALVLISAACSDSANTKLKGSWHTKDGATKIKITDGEFITDNDPAEEYFIKGDTIFTSFKGNQPYTKYIIQQVDEHRLKLLYPDSVSIDFAR